MPRACSRDLRERVLAACDAGHASRVVTRQYRVSRALRRLGLTLKKILVAQEQTRPDVCLARQRWRAAQPTLVASRLVFIDESGFATNLTRRRGRAPRGQRCGGRVPYRRWQTTTFIDQALH